MEPTSIPQVVLLNTKKIEQPNLQDPRLMYKWGEQPRTVHNIDAPGWLAQGWSYEPQTAPPAPSSDVIDKSPSDGETSTIVEPPTENPATVADLPAALVFINAAQSAADLTPLPSIGEKAASAILGSRPEEGYASLEAVRLLNPKLTYVDWDALAAWEG